MTRRRSLTLLGAGALIALATVLLIMKPWQADEGSSPLTDKELVDYWHETGWNRELNVAPNFGPEGVGSAYVVGERDRTMRAWVRELERRYHSQISVVWSARNLGSNTRWAVTATLSTVRTRRVLTRGTWRVTAPLARHPRRSELPRLNSGRLLTTPIDSGARRLSRFPKPVSAHENKNIALAVRVSLIDGRPLLGPTQAVIDSPTRYLDRAGQTDYELIRGTRLPGSSPGRELTVHIDDKTLFERATYDQSDDSVRRSPLSRTAANRSLNDLPISSAPARVEWRASDSLETVSDLNELPAAKITLYG